MPRLAAGSRAPDAHEQPRPRGRREPRRARRVRRHRPGRPRAGTRSTRSSASSARLADDETLLVQSGKPVAVFRTHEWAPRVLIANSNLVGKWATWEHFRELERDGLMMYGQMTAGSWIYIGTQGILQGTYETFAELARQHFGGSLARAGGADGRPGRDGRRAAARGDDERRRLPRDRGRRGARPAAARHRLRRSPDRTIPAEALAWARAAAAEGGAESIALVGNAAEIEPAWAAAGERFDVVTDQTSAHDALAGYVPAEISLADAAELRAAPSPTSTSAARCARWPTTSGRCSRSRRAGAVVFDYGNNLRARRSRPGVADAFDYPGFVPAFIRPQFCEGRGPFRWAALSRRSGRHRCGPTGPILELFPDDAGLRRWIEMAAGEGPVPGAAGADLLAGLRRAGEGRAWRSTSWSGPARSRRRS